MARTDEGVKMTTLWAASGERMDPETNLVTRSQGWDKRFEQLGGLVPNYEVFNQIIRELSGVAVCLNQHGIPPWSRFIDYTHNANERAFVLRNEGLYVSTAASGPTQGGAVDPATDSNRSHWKLY